MGSSIRRYAADTSVSVERSKGEIDTILARYGASQFMSGWDSSGRAMVGFVLSNRMVRITLQLPSLTAPEFSKSPSGRRTRRPEQARAAHEQACRASWRALALVIRAKLEAVQQGITTFENEFLAHIVLPNGQTAGEFVLPGAGGTGR